MVDFRVVDVGAKADVLLLRKAVNAKIEYFMMVLRSILQ